MKPERLWIVEKPDMARSLAAGLALTYGISITNKATSREDGCIIMSNGDAVMPLFGHMLESAPPSDYLTKEQNSGDYFKFLPLIPPEFIKYPKAARDSNGKRKVDADGKPIPGPEFKKMIRLIKDARQIVNAGDTDREGQLIVDELLEFAGIDPEGKHKPVWRLALEDPKDVEIKKLIEKGLEKNSDPFWVRKRMSAQTRSESDWSLGMTCSMAYQQVTGYRRMSVGRVKTPTMAMVVRRDLKIENFKPVQYFVPVITLADGTVMRWEGRDGSEGLPGFDEMGRITSRALADEIVARIASGMSGRINLADIQRFKENPPLPFSLGALQSTAARQHGLTLKEVSKAAQSLYEKHKSISYVGTDCQFLPTSLLDQVHSTVKSLSVLYGKAAAGANLDLRSQAWNDDKTQEHFAIIPTGDLPNGANDHERAVFETVSRRFMAQFYPAHEFIRHRVGAAFGQDNFKAVRKEITKQGWHDVEGVEESEEDPDAIEVTERNVDARTNKEAQR